jgi:lysophospholipase L1-like esterase
MTLAAMISSLFAAVFAALSRKRDDQSRQWIKPSVEVLEDRSLPSAAMPMPTPAEVPFLIDLSDALAAAAPKGNPDVVFLGDSISFQYAYGTGAPIWNAYMAPLGMANYGISGQTTQSLLFQLTQGQLVGINPSVVVLDIGGNDLLAGDSPLATAAGVLTDVAAIRQYLPDAHVLVLGILPGKESPSDPYRTEGAQTNQLVVQMLAGEPHATFLNFGSIFLQPNGTISTSMMFDYVHPTEQGYVDLTNALLPVIEQALLSTSTTLSATSTLPLTDFSSFPLASLMLLGVPSTSPSSAPLPQSPP